MNHGKKSYLDFTSFIVSNEGIAIVYVIHDRTGQTSVVTLAVESGAKRLINVLTIGQNGLIG